MRKRENKFICSMCLPDVKEVGEIVPCMWLGLDKDGKYVIVFGSHGKDIIHKFKKDPWIDPLEKLPGETEAHWEKRYDSAPKALCKKNIAWVRMAQRELGFKIDLDSLMQWASYIKGGGWREKDGSVTVWLYERCAKLRQGFWRGKKP